MGYSLPSGKQNPVAMIMISILESRVAYEGDLPYRELPLTANKYLNLVGQNTTAESGESTESLSLNGINNIVERTTDEGIT